MCCPYCHGPLCRVMSHFDEKTHTGHNILWRCIVCGADTHRPKKKQRAHSHHPAQAVLYSDK